MKPGSASASTAPPSLFTHDTFKMELFPSPTGGEGWPTGQGEVAQNDEILRVAQDDSVQH
jgi:hypothetical protein